MGVEVRRRSRGARADLGPFVMEYCYDCGAASPMVGEWPTCPEHGPRWKLRRNAPCAEVALERDGRVLMVRRARDPFAGYWEFPGGYVDLGETPMMAAIREAREELGVDVALTAALGVFVVEWQPGECVQVHLFTARCNDEIDADPSEIAETRWCAAGDAPDSSTMSPGTVERFGAWATGQRAPLVPGQGA